MRIPRLAGMTLFVIAAAMASHATGRAAPPNIVLIIGDDQGWTDYGFMGSRDVHTSHLDRLAAESLVFPRGYVPSSLCRPSLATMVTGWYPHQHGITSNDPPYPAGVPAAQRMKDARYLADRAAMVARFEQSPNLPKRLAAKGYVSHQSGKWWEGDACRCGFTEGMTHGDPARGGRHGDEGLKIGREGLTPVFQFLDRARADGKPFYLWYAPMMPHSPHNPPERLLKRYRDRTPSIHVARYWAMCEWFDETVGELLAKLKDNGQAESTIVVYLHDNGWIQDPKSAAYAPKSKQSPYDGGLRTPILVRWPGKIAPRKSPALVSSIDLVPTILTAAGLSPDDGLPGVNLLDADVLKKRDRLMGEIFLHTANYLQHSARNLRFRWIIHGDWKLIVPDPVNEPTLRPELFHIMDDPHEMNNRAALFPERVASMTKLLDVWWRPDPALRD